MCRPNKRLCRCEPFWLAHRSPLRCFTGFPRLLIETAIGNHAEFELSMKSFRSMCKALDCVGLSPRALGP